MLDSPNVQSTLAAGRPQPCNLCHIDTTLAWTAEKLKAWYEQPIPPLTERQKTVSAALMDLLSGDAGQRAIAAWHMGWEPALKAAGRDWIAPVLAELLDDPYAIVRYIAYHSMQRLLVSKISNSTLRQFRPGVERLTTLVVGGKLSFHRHLQTRKRWLMTRAQRCWTT